MLTSAVSARPIRATSRCEFIFSVGVWLILAIGVSIPKPGSTQAKSSDADRKGSIHGVVFGPPEGTPLKGVVVRIDGSRAAETNSDGGFSVDLEPGVHTVALSTEGGEEARVEEVRVRPGETTEVITEFRSRGPPKIKVEAPGKKEDEGSRNVDGEPEGTPKETGLVRGTVLSSESGEPLQGARILIRGSSRGAETNSEGEFEIELPVGTHDLSVVHSEYSTASREKVTVRAGEPTELEFELAPAAVRLSAHEVRIPKIEGGSVQLMRDKRKSSSANEVIGAEQFSKSGDSTAAGALKRVTGLTVVGGKFVYVRGMGSRYSSSLLNGSTLPSPEPNKRVVPLDLFPTSILQKVTVQKTYTPDMPGGFGGGAVKMHTKSYPDDFELDVGLSISGATDTTFRNGLTYDGGSLDWLGVDDGSRQLPTKLKKATRGKSLSKKDRFGRGNFTAEELEKLGESLPNNWNTEERTVMPNLGVGVGVGDSIDLGGVTLGFRFAGKYDYSHNTNRYRENTYNASGDAIEQDNSYRFTETNDHVVTSAIFSGGIDFDENNLVELTSTINRVTDDETRTYEGFFSDHGDDIRLSRLQWVERQMMFHQIRGEHVLPEASDLKLNWNYVFSQARREEPDRREYRYDWETDVDAFALSDRPEGNSRLWSKLIDNNHDGQLSARLPFDVWKGLGAWVEVGGGARRKDRQVDTRRFQFFADRTDLELFQKPPEEIFTEGNIGSDAFFELRETTRSTDNYEGSHAVYAGYGMLEVPVIESVRINGGARIEHSRQRVRTFALFSDDEKKGRLKTTDVLPALNATWKFLEDMQLRGGVSRTVNRPNLRELSRARFTNVVGGREFQGNPELKRAFIRHADLRWEWYPERGENVSVGGFYKDFEDPIELTFEPGATPVIQPANVQGARNFGVEFQGRTNLDFVSKGLRDLYVAGNLSLIDSRIRIDPDSDKAEVLTTTSRPLQGQSPYVVNAQISYDNVDIQTTATLLYNVYGPRISEVGIFGIPNVVEEPFHSLDFTFSRMLGNGLELDFEASNLLNLPRRFTQGGRITHREFEGRSFSLGVSWSPG